MAEKKAQKKSKKKGDKPKRSAGAAAVGHLSGKVTRFPTTKEAQSARKWFVVDAEGATLGRLASKVAAIIRGKHKTSFSRHVDCGDFVVVVNAEKFRVTGNKLEQKVYQRYSGYPGGITERPIQWMLDRKPTQIIENAVRGMLPPGDQRKRLIQKLKVYVGPEHPHAAQKPELMQL